MKPPIPVLTDAICDGELSLGDYARIGWFTVRRARRLAAAHGTKRAAATWRKRGFRFRVVRLMLLGRRS